MPVPAVTAFSRAFAHRPFTRPRAAGFLLVWTLLCVLASALTGCSLGGGSRTASTETPAGVTVKKGARGTKPYTIKGNTYYPLLSSHGFREQGVASWYGPGFHGKLTANGERYDMHGMTAAHKLLPFGTRVKVTNRENGKSIVVRINDRGPFAGDRVIDLTRAGAEKIGMIAKGTAPVLLETQGQVKGLKDGDLAGSFYVQVGAFANKSNADGLAAKIRTPGRGARVVWADQVGLWRVQAGPFDSLHKAESGADGMSAEFPNAFVVAE